ncbi:MULTISPECIES: hypothetical protein [unclassified Phenylobacterium]|uniref:hypothetical protein n=1 Tax=unclassified Phenylobacterium TaxID=2640670 RepID=UPI0012E8A4DD|nr:MULTISPECIES: hypothetical protein [unclassified Phenylobacterium]
MQRRAPTGSTLIVVPRRLRSPSVRNRFRLLSLKTERWMSRQRGFLRYSLFETEDGWMELFVWQSSAEAETAHTRFNASGIAADLAGILDPDDDSRAADPLVVGAPSA